MYHIQVCITTGVYHGVFHIVILTLSAKIILLGKVWAQFLTEMLGDMSALVPLAKRYECIRPIGQEIWIRYLNIFAIVTTKRTSAHNILHWSPSDVCFIWQRNSSGVREIKMLIRLQMDILPCVVNQYSHAVVYTLSTGDGEQSSTVRVFISFKCNFNTPLVQYQFGPVRNLKATSTYQIIRHSKSMFEDYTSKYGALLRTSVSWKPCLASAPYTGLKYWAHDITHA